MVAGAWITMAPHEFDRIAGAREIEHHWESAWEADDIEEPGRSGYVNMRNMWLWRDCQQKTETEKEGLRSQLDGIHGRRRRYGRPIWRRRWRCVGVGWNRIGIINIICVHVHRAGEGRWLGKREAEPKKWRRKVKWRQDRNEECLAGWIEDTRCRWWKGEGRIGVHGMRSKGLNSMQDWHRSNGDRSQVDDGWRRAWQKEGRQEWGQQCERKQESSFESTRR